MTETYAVPTRCSRSDTLAPVPWGGVMCFKLLSAATPALLSVRGPRFTISLKRGRDDHLGEGVTANCCFSARSQITRLSFSFVPLHFFALLWHRRDGPGLDGACRRQLRSQRIVGDELFSSNTEAVWTGLKYTHQFKNAHARAHTKQAKWKTKAGRRVLWQFQ